MADIKLTYKGSTIAELSATGNKTLKTSGKYCEGDIGVEYTKPSGGGELEPIAGVNFIDYDGKILSQWTPADVFDATELPPNPDHSSDITWAGVTIPLTAQGWNWTLADIQELIYNDPTETLYVGQNYATSDNCVYLCVSLDDSTLNPRVTTAYTSGVTYTIDWGDGTTETFLNTVIHTYATAADYAIKISQSRVTNFFVIQGSTTYGTSIFGMKGSVSYLVENMNYTKCLRKIFLCERVRINNLNYCPNLESVSISTFTQFGLNTYTLCGNLSLKSITLLNDYNVLADYALQNTPNLTRISLPKQVDNGIGASCFEGKTIESFIVPLGANNLNANAFAEVYKIKRIKFLTSTPPNAASYTWYNGLPYFTKFYIQKGSYSSYSTATYYPPVSSYTYVEYGADGETVHLPTGEEEPITEE